MKKNDLYTSVWDVSCSILNESHLHILRDGEDWFKTLGNLGVSFLNLCFGHIVLNVFVVILLHIGCFDTTGFKVLFICYLVGSCDRFTFHDPYLLFLNISCFNNMLLLFHSLQVVPPNVEIVNFLRLLRVIVANIVAVLILFDIGILVLWHRMNHGVSIYHTELYGIVQISVKKKLWQWIVFCPFWCLFVHHVLSIAHFVEFLS